MSSTIAPVSTNHHASPFHFFTTKRGAFFLSIALFIFLLIFYVDILLQSTTETNNNNDSRNQNGHSLPSEDGHGHGIKIVDDDDDKNINDPDAGEEELKNDASSASSSSIISSSSSLRRSRLIEAARRPLDPSIQEWPYEDPQIDGAMYNVSTANNNKNNNFISKLDWKGRCWYHVTNFCVIDGDLILYHDKSDKTTKRGSLRMCNEFSKSSPSIQLKYRSEPTPDVLPGPLLTKTPGWILQFWCQDLFHSTLSIMPAFHTKKYLFSSSSSNKENKNNVDEENEEKRKALQLSSSSSSNNNHNEPDIYLRIARGKRHKGGYCYIKFGHPLSFNVSKNDKWSKGKQFPFNGNPYWSMYKVLSADPWRIHPQYAGSTKKRACYKTGIIDKLYIKDINRRQGREYSDAQLANLLGSDWRQKTKKRECKKYRITIIDRQGKTRRLTNIPEIMQLAKSIDGFAQVESAKFEFLTLQEQIRLIVDTDLLIGMHGNGLMWQQFLQHGSCLIELLHTWYQPYAKLFGHSYFHSSMRHNPVYKKQGEYVPYAHNMTEMEELLRKAKAALDSTSCDARELPEGVKPKIFDMEEKLDYMYKDCAPHC